MGELAIVLHRTPGDHEPTELGIVGPLTHVTTPALLDYLRHLLDTTTTRGAGILLDMTCCTHLDVDGLRAVASSQQAARMSGEDLHLVRTPPLIARQVRQQHFERLLLDPAADEEGWSRAPDAQSRDRPACGVDPDGAADRGSES